MQHKKTRAYLSWLLVLGLVFTSGIFTFADDDPLPFTDVTSSASGGTSWPQMGGVPNSNPNTNPNANQVVTLSWPAASDVEGETYEVWYGKTGDADTSYPAEFALSPAVPAKNGAGTTWSAATTIKSGNSYQFYVKSSVRGNSNVINQAIRNGNIGPDQLVDNYINLLPADPKNTKIADRYNLVRIRKVYQKLTRYDRETIADKLRHFELCEAYWMADWVKGVYEQFKLDPETQPDPSSEGYAKWRATAELLLSREGAQWFMRWGSANVHEYGHNLMVRNDPELRQILADTGATAMLDDMDKLRDQFVEERKAAFKKVKEGVQAQIEGMDPEQPTEVAAARAAYDALTPFERTFITNLTKLLRAEGESIVPPNVKGSGMRSSSYGPGSPWPSPTEWGAMNSRMKEHFPGSRSENIWIIGNLGSPGDFGGGVNFNFSWTDFLARAAISAPDLVDRTSANAANHTYKGKTQAQWNRAGAQFATNMGSGATARHEETLTYFDNNDIYVYLSVEAGYADMQEMIDISFYMYGHHKSVIGFAIDVEWHMGNTEDSGIGVTDDMAKAWNLTMKAHDPSYRMALKDYEASRLPWNYRGEEADGYDLIFCIDAQSFGDLDGTTVGYYEANGAWYASDYWYGNWSGKYTARDGAAVGNQLFYHDWSTYFYPNDVTYQFGYTGDRHWMGAMDMPFEGLEKTPYPQVMSSLVAWQAPLDQNVGIAWVDFNLRGFTGFPEVFNTTASALGGQVNTALGLLAQSGSNWVGQRFTNPNAATLYGGGPVISDAMYVKRMREMVNEADAKGWTGISAANRNRLELLEPLAIDVRINALPTLKKMKHGNRFTVDTLLADYNALTDAQKAQVKGADALFAAKARVDALGVSVLAYLSTAEESDIDKNIEFDLSIANAKELLTFEAEIVIDGSMMASVGIEPLNGFTLMSDIFWKSQGGDVWMGTVTLAYKAGDREGFTTHEPMSIAKFVFAPRAKGDTALTLTKIKASGLVGDVTKYFDTLIEEGVAMTNIDQRVFSKYDLNRDGLVDALDLGIMLLYCGFDKDSPDWAARVKVNDSRGKGVTASMCDVNGDGVIDMLDLLDLFIHYTK